MVLKAYAVLEDGENTGGIVWAGHNVVARREGASIFGDGDFSGMSCTRAPWADGYTHKTLPISLMIENGWRFECCGCGATINEDFLDAEDLPLEGVIGTQHSKVYCSEICECRDNLEHAIKRDHERRAIEALRAYVLKRFPGVTIGAKENWAPHAYASNHGGAWQVRQVVISFEFPGQKIAPAACRIDRDQQNARLIGPIRPEYSCCFGDRETFEAWVASPQSRQKATEPA